MIALPRWRGWIKAKHIGDKGVAVDFVADLRGKGGEEGRSTVLMDVLRAFVFWW